MNYWIFKINPERYRLDERLIDHNPQITCAVTRYAERIRKGDTVFLWRASVQRGICAVMLVEQCPYEPTEKDLNDGFELPPGSITRGVDHWARCRLVQRFPLIEASVIKKIEGLELFSFFSAFQQAINYSITRPEGSILLEFIERHKDEMRETASKPASVPKKTETARPRKDKPAPKPAGGPTDFALLKCEECGRYVVNTDTERHVREIHAGQAVTWKKTK